MRLAEWYTWPKKPGKKEKYLSYYLSKFILSGRSEDVVKQQWNRIFLVWVHLPSITEAEHKKLGYLSLPKGRNCFMQETVRSLRIVTVTAQGMRLDFAVLPFLIWFQQNLLVALVNPNVMLGTFAHCWVYLKMIRLAKSTQR